MYIAIYSNDFSFLLFKKYAQNFLINHFRSHFNINRVIGCFFSRFLLDFNHHNCIASIYLHHFFRSSFFVYFFLFIIFSISCICDWTFYYWFSFLTIYCFVVNISFISFLYPSLIPAMSTKIHIHFIEMSKNVFQVRTIDP